MRAPRQPKSVSSFSPFVYFGDVAFFQIFFVPLLFSLCMESTLYVFSFQMVYFLVQPCFLRGPTRGKMTMVQKILGEKRYLQNKQKGKRKKHFLFFREDTLVKSRSSQLPASFWIASLPALRQAIQSRANVPFITTSNHTLPDSTAVHKPVLLKFIVKQYCTDLILYQYGRTSHEKRNRSFFFSPLSSRAPLFDNNNNIWLRPENVFSTQTDA